MNEYEKVLNEVHRLNSKKSMIEGEVRKLELNLKSLSEFIAQSKNSISTLDQKIKELKSQESLLLESVVKLNKQIRKEEERLHSIEGHVEKQRLDLAKKEIVLSEKQKELEEKNSDLKAIRNDLLEFEGRLSSRELALDKKENELNSLCKVTYVQIEKEKEKLSSIEKSIQSSKEELQGKENKFQASLELLLLKEKEVIHQSKLQDAQHKQLIKEKEKIEELNLLLLKKENELKEKEKELKSEIQKLENLKKETELDQLRICKLAREKNVMIELENLKKALATFALCFCVVGTVYGGETTVDGGSDVQVRKNSVLFYEKSADPSVPLANGLKLYAKDSGGVTTLYTIDNASNVTELGAAGSGGSGDITRVGDATTGDVFSGTSGTTLTFNNAGGDMTLAYDGTDLQASKLLVGNAGLKSANGATSGGFLDIFEDSDAGTNKTRFIAQAQAGDITYTLPADDGDAGEQLQTDGSGALTWEAAGSGSGAPTDATYITQTANVGLSAEQALSSLSTGIMRVATTTGVITSLTSSSDIAGNISDETGTGVMVFGTAPTLLTADVKNGATSAGYLSIYEDSDDGSNYTRLQAQAQAGNVTYTLPAADAAVSGYLLSSNASGTLSWVAPASGSGTKTYSVFNATDNQPPASNFATLDTRNSIAVLDFDTTTEESAIFVGVIPEAASLGSGLIVKISWAATSATSGDCRWGAQIQRNTTDLDSDSFDTATEGTSATNGTSGIITVTSLTLTNIDSVTAGDSYRLKIYRDVTDAADTMSADAEIVAVELRSAT